MKGLDISKLSLFVFLSRDAPTHSTLPTHSLHTPYTSPVFVVCTTWLAVLPRRCSSSKSSIRWDMFGVASGKQKAITSAMNVRPVASTNGA